MQPDAQEALRRYRQRNGRDFLTQKPIEKNAAGLTPEQERVVLEAIESRSKSTAGGNSAGADYMAMVAKYREAKKCSTFDAMMAVNATDEGKAARIRYIKQINPHIANYGE